MSDVSISKPPSSGFSLFLQTKKENRATGDIKQQEITESVTSLGLNTKAAISSRQSYRARLSDYYYSTLFLVMP